MKLLVLFHVQPESFLIVQLSRCANAIDGEMIMAYHHEYPQNSDQTKSNRFWSLSLKFVQD